jgi:hypothetical protein
MVKLGQHFVVSHEVLNDFKADYLVKVHFEGENVIHVEDLKLALLAVNAKKISELLTPCDFVWSDIDTKNSITFPRRGKTECAIATTSVESANISPLKVLCQTHALPKGNVNTGKKKILDP